MNNKVEEAIGGYGIGEAETLNSLLDSSLQTNQAMGKKLKGLQSDLDDALDLLRWFTASPDFKGWKHPQQAETYKRLLTGGVSNEESAEVASDCSQLASAVGEGKVTTASSKACAPLPAYTKEADIEAMAKAIANTKVSPYSALQHALYASPLIDGTASSVRRDVGLILWQAATAALSASPVHAELERVRAENRELRSSLLDMVLHFCGYCDRLSHSFSSSEKDAFSVLGIENGMTFKEAYKQALQQKGGE